MCVCWGGGGGGGMRGDEGVCMCWVGGVRGMQAKIHFTSRVFALDLLIVKMFS